MAALKESVSLTIDTDIYDAIKELAIRDKRKISPYVNLVLRGHVGTVEAEGKLHFDKSDAGYIIVPAERGLP